MISISPEIEFRNVIKLLKLLEFSYDEDYVYNFIYKKLKNGYYYIYKYNHLEECLVFTLIEPTNSISKTNTIITEQSAIIQIKNQFKEELRKIKISKLL